MNLQLIEEINPGNGTMYAVKVDDYTVRWFAHMESAEKFFNEIKADPNLLKKQTNILKSEEINVSLDSLNQ